MSKNMKKNLTILLLFVAVIGLATYLVKDYLNKDKNKSKLEQPIVDTFLYDFRDGYDYSSGSAQILGYVEIENRSDGASLYQYVTFHVLESNSVGFTKFLESNADNTYVSKDSIGLGCLIDNKIKLLNYSDAYGEEGYINSVRETNVNYNELLASTKDNPVTLNIRKYVSTMYYSYHPICESMLTDFSTPIK
jgi:hypothetical protein